MKKFPRNELLTAERVVLSIRQRFNPIKSITADALSNAHDEFDRGSLRNAAMIWEVIEDRDDMVKAVSAKRKKNIARNGFEVVTFPKEGTDHYVEALKQKRALEYFYDQVLVTHAIDANERGGFKLLVRQMMDAIGKKFAVHEVLWKPTADGLTAELRFVPLWFFENTQGRLRFLMSPYAMEGVELKDGAWLVTVGDGIMKPCAIAWMRKNLALSDWSDYSGSYGKPGIIASTTAARGAEQFEGMEEALSEFLVTKSMVLNSAENVKVVDFASANPSFEPLVERMDRLISALWRGSDLSTISKSQGYGASVQQGETQILEEDDAQLITETLQKHIDRRVIEFTFGQRVPGFEERKEFNKLVRDRIPDIIQSQGERVTTSRLDPESHIKALREKLIEESYELLDAKDLRSIVGEMADIREVLDCLCRKLNIDHRDVGNEQARKRDERGSLLDGVVLVETENALPTSKSAESSQGQFEGFLVEPGKVREVTEAETRRRAESLDKRTDRRIVRGRIEVQTTFSAPVVRSEWGENTNPEVLLSSSSNRVIGRVRAKRVGASWNIELTVSIDQAQLELPLTLTDPPRVT